jgi:hypothetical protein
MPVTRRQADDWASRLMALSDEMDRAFGDPAPGCHERPLAMATYLALREAVNLRDDLLSAEIDGILDYQVSVAPERKEN